MRHYCALFSDRYLPQGLVLYESLLKHSSEPFTLYLLPMDLTTRLALLAMFPSGETVRIVDTDNFVERMNLGHIKTDRSFQEACWTCASNLAAFLISELRLPEITYLDADMMFFSDPKVIHDEIGDRSIAVIPHRLIPSKRYLEVNGKFNVSLVHFTNNPIGRECLSTWAWQCREKCSATDGCGDQGYVDCWDTKYGHELCVIQNIGAGAAPWNLANWPVTEGPNLGGQPIVFFHAHEFRCNPDGTFFLSGYDLRDEDREFIYRPYVESIQAAQRQIKEALSHTVS